MRTIAGFALGREIKDRGRWDCSPLQAWSLVHAGVLPESFRPRLQQITPDTLWAVASALAHDRSND